ncbi:hypothetical protein DFH11DRAFT_1522056, partial [Phellopilus nigrolimitatus]
HPDGFSIDQSELYDVLSSALRQPFSDLLAENSTVFEDEDGKTGALRSMPACYLCHYRTRRQPSTPHSYTRIVTARLPSHPRPH